MENFYAEIKKPLEVICKLPIQNELQRNLQKYLAKQIWTPHDRKNLLSALSSSLMSLDYKSCLQIATLVGPLTVDLLYRCSFKLDGKDLNEDEYLAMHERICIVIGLLSHTSLPSLKDFALSYLAKNGAPFRRLSQYQERDESEIKKRKKMKSNQFSSVLESTYQLVMNYPSVLTCAWEWSVLVQCLQDDNVHITSRGRWFVKKILGIVVGVCDISSSELSCEEEHQLMLDSQLAFDPTLGSNIQCVVTTKESKLSHTQQAIVSSDLSSPLVAVCGILLQRHLQSDEASNFVVTPSLLPQLKQLALAVAEGKAAIIEGPVGCGKTALVEHLAQVTGRIQPPHLTKIQLSDDTDSKTLTGTYVCTPTPGEFLWQPGILVQSCMKGHWLLLEDIDRAPNDVVSLLLPLIESGKLSVPGRHSEDDAVSSKFRLFMTRRVGTRNMSSQNHNIDMISKHARVIKLASLPEQDLKQIILAKYPSLTSIADKLLVIFTKLGCDKDLSTFTNQRKSLTRDLLKWCHRVSSSAQCCEVSDLANDVAMSAIDCLVASCPDAEVRLSLTKQICSELNMLTEKANHYCFTYKPEVVIEQKTFKIGRFATERIEPQNFAGRGKQPFATTRHSCVLLERVACCVANGEPLLLVGETGVGKTSALQYLAQETGHHLHVLNMSQQSSSSDLLGGYKPAQLRYYVAPVREKFEELFPQTFSRQRNRKMLSHLQNCFVNKRYKDLWELMMHATKAALKRIGGGQKSDETLLSSWQQMSLELKDLKKKLKSDCAIAFSFVEGKLSQSIKRGEWLLLDEINLAAPDTLECLSGVLESLSGSIFLMERGDAKPIERHRDFRLFAAMNPATDVGKRNLTEGIRNRFTEIFVDEVVDHADIATIVSYYLKQRMVVGSTLVNGIVQFYDDIRTSSDTKLFDGMGRKPCYSLRTLCRALSYVVNSPKIPFQRALYEGFCLSFLTALDRASHPFVINLIIRHIVGRTKIKSIVSQPLPKPDYAYVTIEGHHIRCGSLAPSRDEKYIITASVKENLQDLARPVSYGKYPILIQGETSTGKTSLIKYLAAVTGNKVIRINNHEHTDLQEYVGYYASDESGRLVFQDGPLVTAMREGYWIILDELNLAPTDILEALNRVLDDNRELFITETQEVVHAHPSFTLFATQNPPGVYGGRKVLSRAFRNRFVELHFDEIPSNELKTILQERCCLAPNHAAKLVKIMIDLQARRRASGLFAGKHGFITFRDLFRWAERYRRHQVESIGFYDWEQHLADDGFLLLAGRVRKRDEEKVIEEVLEKHLGRRINRDRLFSLESLGGMIANITPEFSHIVWTEPMRRLFVTLERALRFDEPVLLVGETGGGKTSACQMISAIMEKKLSIVNCHANTEAADFIGGLRPARGHKEEEEEEDGEKKETKSMKLFEWKDGSLVESMCNGSHILVDEISLADDSVLERLNSVLEPEKSLVIADKILMNLESQRKESAFIVAKEGFQFMATMNPGGDYGKKELSPALRNRMTEIWCDVVHSNDDFISILQHNLHLTPFDNKKESSTNAETYARLIVEFVTWFKATIFGKRFVISVRDLLTWSKFMNVTCRDLDLPTTYIHAACLVYVDGIGSGLSGSFASQSHASQTECLKFILSQLRHCGQLSMMSPYSVSWLESKLDPGTGCKLQMIKTRNKFGIEPFSISIGFNANVGNINFAFTAPTTSTNAVRVLRALQLSRPILLEGSPGGGKTSLVSAIAQATSNVLVRINLSEQTDASDLFGADLPVEDGVGGEFAWRDGPLLAALKSGHWLVLDELNLASQSVLESLNGVFDHRGELFVPELGRSFHVDRERTKVFACQNPMQEGGGRKALPKSFLNRFTQVHVDNLSSDDLLFILQARFPQIDEETLKKMVMFNRKIHQQVVCNREWGHRGSPWEFNLRDMTRWCDLVSNDTSLDPSLYIFLVYSERMRTSTDRSKVLSVFREIFSKEPYLPTRNFHMTSRNVQIGNCVMQRKSCFSSSATLDSSNLIPSMLHGAEALMQVLNMNWPCLLTGASGSGKTCLVKTVAALVGHKLQILSTNSSMDAIELLGGFEQSDATKSFINIVAGVKTTLLAISQNILKSNPLKKELNSFQNLLKVFERLQKCEQSLGASGTDEDTNDSLRELERELTCAVDIGSDFADESISFRLQNYLKNFKQLVSRPKTRGTYEWTDSVLVKSLQQGDWLLVEGANFCPASVLDRLNALLEPNGLLSITERGVSDGKVVEIKPHPSFRLILSLDPSGGELSRAMRNRCVEIHLLSPTSPFTELCAPHPTDSLTTGGMTWDEANLIVQSKCSNSTEKRLCSQFLSKLQNSTDGNKPPAQPLALQQAERYLETIRRGLYSDEDASLESQEQAVSSELFIKPPSLRDFIARPMLSNVIRQFRIFEYLPEVARSSEFSLDTVFSSFFRIFIELSTKNDCAMRNLTVQEFLPLLVRACTSSDGAIIDPKRYTSLFTTLTQALVSNEHLQQANSNMQNWEDQPWDPRWSMQLLPLAGSAETVDASFYNKMMLLLVYLQLKANEDDIISTFIFKNKRNVLKSASTFQLSRGFHKSILHVSDLPYTAISSLLPLYQSWNKFITESLKSSHLQIPDERRFCNYEENLRRIAYLWKCLMTSRFIQCDFTNLYLRLRKHLHDVNSTASTGQSVDIRNILENLDKTLQINENFQNEARMQKRIRSQPLVSLHRPYSDELSYDVERLLVMLFNELMTYVDGVFKEESMTRASWEELLILMSHFINFYSEPPSNDDDCDFSMSDYSEKSTAVIRLGKIVEQLETFGIKLSEKILKSLPAVETNVSTCVVQPQQHHIFGITQYQRHLRCLLENFNVLSELNTVSTRPVVGEKSSEADKIQLLQSARSNGSLREVFKVLHKPQNFNTWRRFVLGRLCEWQPMQDVFNIHQQSEERISNSIASSEKDRHIGSGNLLRPCISLSVMSLLYDSQLRQAGAAVVSQDVLKELVWSGIGVPVSKIAEKTEQLETIVETLWKQSSLLAQVELDKHAQLSQSFTYSTISLLQTFCDLLQAIYSIGNQIELEEIDELICLCQSLVDTTRTTVLKSSLWLKFEDTILQLVRQTQSYESNSKILTSPRHKLITESFAISVKSMLHLLQSIFCEKISKLQGKIARKNWMLQCWKSLGEAWIWCGNLQLILVAPWDPVDPVKMYKLKAECHQSELLQCRCDVEVRNLSNCNLTGHDLASNDNILHPFPHPRVKSLSQHISTLERKIEKNLKKVAFRPQGAQFGSLCNECSHFTSTILSCGNVKKALSAMYLEKSSQHRGKERSLQESCKFFQKSIEEKYKAYPDFVQPICDALMQVRFGFHLAGTVSEISNFQNKASEASASMSASSVEEKLAELMMCRSSLDINDLSYSLECLLSLAPDKGLKDSQPDFTSDKITESVLVSVLLQMKAKADSYHLVTETKAMMNLFTDIVNLWHVRQEIKQQRAAEKASLFKYQSIKHEIDEESELEEEFNKIFPSFEENVADLEESDKAMDYETPSEEADCADESIDLSQGVLDLTALVHRELVMKQTCQNARDKSRDHSTAVSLMFSHRMMSSPLHILFPRLLGNEMDHGMLGNHILASVAMKKYLCAETSLGNTGINVYVDPAPSEVSDCLPVLRDMRLTVSDKLLVEWPEHPVLNLLVVIIDRILSFSIVSPIMKFVTGLELLLEKSQEWESNASAQVSIATHLEAVTALILRWRKLELKSWNRLLDDAYRSVSRDTTKWWFYLHQLVEDYSVKLDADDCSVAIEEVISSLQKFLETSNIGQFEERLNLLRVFYNHLVLNGQKQGKLSIIILNISQYYGQFLAANKSRVAALREPIEKDLKAFLKIAKWNDINFYSVKDSTTKTHRALFKFIKKFSNSLQEPVPLNVLKGSPSQFTSLTQDSQSRGMLICKNLLETHFKETVSASIDHLSNNEIFSKVEFPHLKRLPVIINKLNKHRTAWKDEMRQTMPHLLLRFEEEISSIVENFKELRSLEPSTAASADEENKKTRLSEAKHIQSRKRRGLADLFKLLLNIGLSYRKGLVWLKNFTLNEFMQTPSPTSVETSTENSNPDRVMSREALKSGENYFYRMVSNLSALSAALTSPNKEVGISNLNRIRGYTAHLYKISLEQRNNLTELNKTSVFLAQLHLQLTGLSKLQDQMLPRQTKAFNNLELCKKAVETWNLSLIKFQDILQCCPKKKCVDGIEVAEPFPGAKSPKAAHCCHGDEMWCEIMKMIDQEKKVLQEVEATLQREISKTHLTAGSMATCGLISQSTVVATNNCLNKLNVSCERVCGKIFPDFNLENTDVASNHRTLHSPLLVSLIDGRIAVQACREQIAENSALHGTDVCDDLILRDLNDLILELMLSMQQMVKDSEDYEEYKGDEDLPENLFMKNIHIRSKTHYENLNVAVARSKVVKLLNLIKEMAGNEKTTKILNLVLQSLVPIVGHFSYVISHVLLMTSVTHRSTCKLNTILASVFTELSNKGYCPPADFEEELAGDKGELKEVEDAGIGEGQGSKDVSEDIEEENQVEDVPGSENKEENEDEIPPEDNAIEMSTDFDGKMQDDAPPDDGDSENEEEKEDLEKQMGDLGDEEDTNKLDERMWGSDDEEEEQEEKGGKKEEKGKGMDADESELAAKDEEVEEGDNEENKKEEKEEDKLGDQSEFDPNERDDAHESEPNPPPEPLDLPDDLKIDEEGGGDDENANDETQEDELKPDENTEEKLDSTENAEEVSEDIKDPEEPEDDKQEEDKQEQGDGEAQEVEEEPVDENEMEDGTEKPAENDQRPSEEEHEDVDEADKKDEDNIASAGNQLPQEEEEKEDDNKVLDKTSRKETDQTAEDEVMQCDDASENVSQPACDEGKDDQASGMATSTDQSGHESSNIKSKNVTDNSEEREEQIVNNERKLGQSDSKRTTSDALDSKPKRLRMIEDVMEDEGSGNKDGDLYQHISDDVKSSDKDALDAATEDQIEEQPMNCDEEDTEEIQDLPANVDADGNENDDVTMEYAEDRAKDEKSSSKEEVTMSDQVVHDDDDDDDDEDVEMKKPDKSENEEEVQQRELPASSLHTNVAQWLPSQQFVASSPEEIAKIREEMEKHLQTAAHQDSLTLSEAESMWHQYQNVTQPLSQELSEKLRLILEPTQAAKLEGDYRSGKRLNMRKVIPYIASGFRKDKIWLRRSKPSKREYQVMIAIDDSSSMADNHTKQLAFESLAVISTALSTLEAGQLAVCNFGESITLLHDFHLPFTDQSGASILQRSSFKQDQTKIGKLLDTSVAFMKNAQTRYASSSADPRIAQLLIIISDGRGIYTEGKKRIEAAVRAANNASIFLAFIILDNPDMKDSILDIKVPVFKESGKMPEIRSYIEDFPFPFYVIIRDVNFLPDTLSEALRQWFEIVTSAD